MRQHILNNHNKTVFNTGRDQNGYAVFSSDNKPLGVVSVDGGRKALCRLQAIPKEFASYLIAIEDKRYYYHGAIDFFGIARAVYNNIKAGKIIQGGSTLTQQLAKNILHDNSKTVSRKFKETVLAIQLENRYSKTQLLELYFNNVYWGKNIYGIRAASLEYFSKEPSRLTISEQLALLTFLRGPNYYLKSNKAFCERFEMLFNKLNSNKIIINKQASVSKIRLANNKLEVYGEKTIDYISKHTNHKTSSVRTTLIRDIQKQTTNYINACKYPTSVLCFSKGNITALGSSYGSNYPFTFHTNVGSTLKPFIYSFLRKNGIKENDIFPSYNFHNLSWNINEAFYPNKKYLTLKEALLLSNNNAFVNASYKVGMDKVLSYLSHLTSKPQNNFVESSILGTSVNGLTLYELGQSYYKFFIEQSSNQYVHECKMILKQIAEEKFGNRFNNSYLKTGTTNGNRERFAMVGQGKTFFAFLRQGNEVNDYSKEGNFINDILRFLERISKMNYKW